MTSAVSVPGKSSLLGKILGRRFTGRSSVTPSVRRSGRAGIEAGISTLKRDFGLDRCTWSGWNEFKQYVWGSIVPYNPLVLARIRLAKV